MSRVCVLQVSARTWAVLHHRLKLSEMPPEEAATALLLRGLMELCIYGGGQSVSGGCCGERDVKRRGGKDEEEHLPVPWSCTDDALLQVISLCRL